MTVMAEDNRYIIEQELMEAYTHGKSYAEIGMPDIEAELLRVRDMAARNGRRRMIRKIASVAACAVVAVGIGVASFNYFLNTSSQWSDKDICVAYIGGHRITDESQVMEMLHDDICNMDTDNELLEVQLDEFFND